MNLEGWGYGAVSDSGFFVARWNLLLNQMMPSPRGGQGAVDAGVGWDQVEC